MANISVTYIATSDQVAKVQRVLDLKNAQRVEDGLPTITFQNLADFIFAEAVERLVSQGEGLEEQTLRTKYHAASQSVKDQVKALLGL